MKIETLMRCHCARWLFQYHQYQMVLFANHKDLECSTQFSFKIDSISISDANMNCTVCNVWLTTDSVSSLVYSLFFLSFSSFYLFFLFFTTCTHANEVDPASNVAMIKTLLIGGTSSKNHLLSCYLRYVVAGFFFLILFVVIFFSSFLLHRFHFSAYVYDIWLTRQK